MLVPFLRGCESLFRMGRICHGVVCLSRSFVDVRACFEWAVSATELYACLVTRKSVFLECTKFKTISRV